MNEKGLRDHHNPLDFLVGTAGFGPATFCIQRNSHAVFNLDHTLSRVNCDRLVFSGHALRRMFERGIATIDVAAAVKSGEVIMHYPDDRPLPSVLLLGYAEGRPLHVVLARDAISTCQIITVYHPDPAIWNDDFKTRR